jgi:hypothetical protein
MSNQKSLADADLDPRVCAGRLLFSSDQGDATVSLTSWDRWHREEGPRATVPRFRTGGNDDATINHPNGR